MNENEPSKLDRLIKEVLTEEDREILKQTDELGFFALSRSQFGGKLGWVTWLIMAIQTVMFGGAFWCGMRFYGAVDVLPAIKWGISGAVLALMALQIKLSLTPQMQADRVIREVKRLQLMIITKADI